MDEPILNILQGGMNTDSPPEFVKEGQYTFALNAIDGNRDIENAGILSNENSNTLEITIPNRYIIGKQNISEDEVVLFLVSTDDNISEIAIYNIKDKTLSVEVSDLNSRIKLNFRKNHWIDSTFRVRKGCLRTIYFTDGYNTPKSYCFDTPEKYLDINGDLDLGLLSFNKKIDSIPVLSVDIKDYGFLKAGQYFVSIQYWDEDGPQSDWLSTTNGIVIYNTTSNSIRDINGNIYVENETYYGDSSLSPNSIYVNISNIDPSYEFYKLAFASAYTNTNTIDEVFITDIIHSSNKEFIFNGKNYKSKGNIDEIIIPNLKIYSADTITQHQHRLVFGGIKDRDIEHKLFQDAANKITSGCIVKKQDLQVLTKDHPSHKLHKLNGGVGYMPGEIYSFGIVYVFDDGTTSPVYHIPGITDSYPTLTGTQKMSTDNEMDYKYTSTDRDFWGSDYTGKSLNNTKVRHHRFPTRKELGINVVDIKYGDTEDISTSYVLAKVTTDYSRGKDLKKESEVLIYLRKKNELKGGSFVVKSENTLSFGSDESYFEYEILDTKTFDPSNYDVVVKAEREVTTTITKDDGSTESVKTKENYYSKDPADLLKFGITKVEITTGESLSKTTRNVDIDTHILGIQFSNITIPKSKYKDSIIGYFFVRNERTESDKTVLSSSIILPLCEGGKDAKYIGFGQVLPEKHDGLKVSKNTYALVYPEFLFNNEIFNFNEIEISGKYELERDLIDNNPDHYIYKNRKYGIVLKNDTVKGTFATEQHAVKDDDGMDLMIYTRNGYPIYKPIDNITIKDKEIEFRQKIGALDHYVEDNKNYHNVTTDNKIYIIKLKEDRELYDGHSALYATLKNTHKNSYQNYYSKPYFALSGKIYNVGETSSLEEFGGDNYTTPIHYNASNIYDIREASRATDHRSIFETIGLIFAFIGGILITVFSAGTLTIVGGALIAAASTALFISSEIKLNNLNKLLIEKYADGLRNTIQDRWVFGMLPFDKGGPRHFYETERKQYPFWGYLRKYFTTKSALHEIGNAEARHLYYGVSIPYNYMDDAVVAGEDGWEDDGVFLFSDTLSNVFFDSSMNTYLRVKSTANISSFVPPNLNEEDSTNQVPYFGTNSDGKDPERDYLKTFERLPVGETDKHKYDKCIIYDEKENKYMYRGFMLSDFYMLNKSYGDIKVKPYFSVGPNEHSTKCNGYFPYRLVWSETSLEEEHQDKYLRFRSNNYKDLDIISGKITNLVNINQDLFIHTDKYLFKQPVNYAERVTGDMTVYIGTGEFMSNPAIKVGYIDDYYYLGIRHKLQSTVTGSGYYFIANDGNLYRFDSNLDNISRNSTMSRWFQNNLYLEDVENVLPWLEEGSGIIIESDNRNDRLLITCKEYNNNLVKKAFTLSYFIPGNSFTSFHSYIPEVYISNGYNLLTFNKSKSSLYKHNIEHSYQEFYGERYPFIIEFSTTKSPLITSTYEYISFKTDAIEYRDNSNILRDDVTFNKALFYNSNQCSGYITLTPKKKQEDASYMMMQIAENSKGNINRNEGDWSFNSIRNNKLNYNAPMFKEELNILYTNKTIVYKEGLLSWDNLEMLRDKYLITRLIFDNYSNIRLKYIYNKSEHIISKR